VQDLPNINLQRGFPGDDIIKSSKGETIGSEIKLQDINRNVCAFNFSEQSTSLSLAEYRNRFFMSNDPSILLKFYSKFSSGEEIIQWMRERPKGATYIHEFEGNKDVVVVIPTADVNGAYAKNCAESVFKSLHIIFVESAEIGDLYFNYAHNVNAGVIKALTYNPRFIIISNDDVYSIEPIENLIMEINKFDMHKIDGIFITESPHHSVLSELAKPRIFRKLLHYLYPNVMFRYLIALEERFNVKFLSVAKSTLFGLLFFQRGYRFLQGMDFFIVSSNYAKLYEGKLLDETFVNAYEDVDLSLRLSFHPDRLARVNYKIGDYYGKSLGKITNRMLRDFAGEVYINYKITHEYSKQLHSFLYQESDRK
jgi:hypothetical protein